MSIFNEAAKAEMEHYRDTLYGYGEKANRLASAYRELLFYQLAELYDSMSQELHDAALAVERWRNLV